MPMYEFVCSSCEARFEKLTSFSNAESGIDCPHCGQQDTRRLMSAFAMFSRGASRESLPMAPMGAGGGCAGSCGCGCAN